MSAIVDELHRAEQALSFIPADIEREKWWKVGAALKHEFGEPGFDVFDGWSRAGESYAEADVRDTWKSLKSDGGITIATLYALAKEYGFDPRQHRAAVIDPAELERRRTDREARAALEEEKTQKTAKHAATLARAVWSKAKPARDDHPYLVRKGLTSIDTLREIHADKLPALLGYPPSSSGQLLAGRVLIAPVKIGSNVSTVEMIDEAGLKSALAGGAKAGGYWAASVPTKTTTRILVAEGVATALSAHRCTGLPAVAALSCGNLKRVAESMRKQFPEAQITVLADIGNGQEEALNAAQSVEGTLALPDFGNSRPTDATDFNDMHQLLGVEAVKLTIENACAAVAEPVGTQPEPQIGFPSLGERPCYRVYEGWQTVEGRRMKPGVYLHTTKAERTDAPPVLIDRWISTPLRVLATTSNGEDAEYGRLLEILSPAGRWKRWAMPMATLAGDGSDALGVLMSEGLIPYFNDKKAVLRYIAEQVPTVRMRAASVTGWSGDAFVLPNSVIGADNIWFQASSRTAPYVTAGTFEEWRGLAALAPGNPLLMLAFSAALAGPLLGPLNIDGAGAHLYGDSSSGKTTAIQAAVSVWGSPAFKRTWRGTANGVEGVCSQHSDTLMALDELGQIDPKSLDETAYAIGNGTGKTRANRHGEARQASRWRVFLLSTGELTIAARMSAGGIEAKAGQELRILDVPVSGKYGLFDSLHGRPSGAALSDDVRNLAARHYGHAGPRFVGELVAALRAGLNLAEELQPLLERFGVDGQERRAARTFAICGLAGELATRWSIVPWKAGAASRAAIHAFELWRRRRGTNGQSAEHASILRSVSEFIDRHSDSRFSNIDGSADIVRDRAGYWRQENGRRLYLFTSGGLREAAKGQDLLRVLAALEKAKALAATDIDKRSKKTRDPTGRAVPLYHIDPDALSCED